ncbi:hypothetical protein SK128_002400 [Halocaridina rubra]|uniref:Uncharacterized protein n=1 Tax=Halocaridina rubra TaxID=373956 RepID=A0AAN8ZSJ9_HALRR
MNIWHCRALLSGSKKRNTEIVILPNIGSLHHLHYDSKTSQFREENAAYQISFTVEESPCHKVITVNHTDSHGWIVINPQFFEHLQCEWWIWVRQVVPSGSLTSYFLPSK